MKMKDISQPEHDALVALYNNTDGDNWRNNSGWLTDTDIGNWYGVTVSDGHVVEIDLYDKNLTGTIPTELCNLRSLQELDLSNNQLSGEIPSVLGNLSSLLKIAQESHDALARG